MKLLATITAVLALSSFSVGYCASDMTLIYSFNERPTSNSVTPDDGVTLYAHSDSSLFKVDTASHTLTVLPKPPFSYFQGNLTLSQDKRFLYGAGGAGSHEVIFKTGLDGAYEPFIHTFSWSERFEEGYRPVGTLVLTHDEKTLFGVTESGGARLPDSEEGGVLYQIGLKNPDNPEYKILHTFSDGKDGSKPNGVLVLSPDEHFLYGLTRRALSYEKCGTLFRVSLKNPKKPTFKTLRTFKCEDTDPQLKTLIISKDGNTLYATSSANYGSVLKVALDQPRYPMTVLHTFSKNEEGQNPIALALSQDEQTLIGITKGTSRKYYSYYATLFKIALGDTTPLFSLLYIFDWNKDASSPFFPTHIMLNKNKDILYGVSERGGVYGSGSFFQYALGAEGQGAPTPSP